MSAAKKSTISYASGLQRLKSLLGIVHAPTQKFEVACEVAWECHQELSNLATAPQDEAAVISRLRGEYKELGGDAYLGFEVYTGKIKYHCSLLRHCKPAIVTSMEAAMNKLEAEVQALKLEIETLKRK